MNVSDDGGCSPGMALYANKIVRPNSNVLQEFCAKGRTCKNVG